MTPLESLALSRGTVDRVTHQRTDQEWLDAAWADPRTRVLVVSAGQALVRMDDEHAEPWSSYRRPRRPTAPGSCSARTRDGVVYFGVSGALPRRP